MHILTHLDLKINRLINFLTKIKGITSQAHMHWYVGIVRQLFRSRCVNTQDLHKTTKRVLFRVSPDTVVR